MEEDDVVPSADTGNALERIARILDVPAASFFVPEPYLNTGRAETAANEEDLAQVLAVMRLFLQLKDPEARARCVSFIIQELLLIR
ncbi:MAG: hypothetical protein EOO77_12835 [Oxalobacteraceae bacterium]|nr:MAG: hypothetical protein EOO77_12835 [Oxalobacteraceae bacterium]